MNKKGGEVPSFTWSTHEVTLTLLCGMDPGPAIKLILATWTSIVIGANSQDTAVKWHVPLHVHAYPIGSS